MPTELASLNGEILPLDEARVSVLDRGFLFGDGIYEVVRLYGGQPFLFDEHWRRLGRSLEGIKIAVDLPRLADRARALIAKAAPSDAILYVQVTRGPAPKRAHAFPPNPRPTELLWVSAMARPGPEERVRGEKAITYPDVRWAKCDLKTVNLLGNVLAAQAAREAGVYETLLVNREGKVTEGSRTNVFGVKNGTLFTHPLGAAILPGVTRECVVRLARENGVPLEEQSFPASELGTLDELFVSGSTSEVMPIVEVDGQAVGGGKAGPVTLRCAELFELEIARRCG